MGNMVRAAMAVAVVMIPGSFAAVLAFVAFRSIRKSYLKARQAALQAANPQSEKTESVRREVPVAPMKAVLAGLSVRNLVAEARAVAF